MARSLRAAGATDGVGAVERAEELAAGGGDEDPVDAGLGEVERDLGEELVGAATLRSYVEAMGGRLEVRAVFDDTEVPIAAFGQIGEEAASQDAPAKSALAAPT